MTSAYGDVACSRPVVEDPKQIGFGEGDASGCWITRTPPDMQEYRTAFAGFRGLAVEVEIHDDVIKGVWSSHPFMGVGVGPGDLQCVIGRVYRIVRPDRIQGDRLTTPLCNSIRAEEYIPDREAASRCNTIAFRLFDADPAMSDCTAKPAPFEVRTPFRDNEVRARGHSWPLSLRDTPCSLPFRHRDVAHAR